MLHKKIIKIEKFFSSEESEKQRSVTGSYRSCLGQSKSGSVVTFFPLLLLFLFCLSCGQGLPDNDSPRYIITSPEVGEIVYILQGTENVVGVTEEVNYPVAFQQIPKVGSFGGVSIERIINLNPSLVLTSGLEQDKLAGDLNKLGIKTKVVYPHTVEEMLDSIEDIACKLDIPERGKAVRDSLEKELNKYSYQKKEGRPRVYVEIYGSPIMSVSQKSFVGEIIDLAGGDNIFYELPRDYSRVKQEDVIRADPEIIILTYPGVKGRDIKSRRGWGSIKACKEYRIYTIDEIDPDLIIRAGPRAVEGLKQLRKIFHKNNRSSESKHD